VPQIGTKPGFRLHQTLRGFRDLEMGFGEEFTDYGLRITGHGFLLSCVAGFCNCFFVMSHLHVTVNHHSCEVFEIHFRFPSKFFFCFCWITEK